MSLLRASSGSAMMSATCFVSLTFAVVVSVRVLSNGRHDDSAYTFISYTLDYAWKVDAM